MLENTPPLGGAEDGDRGDPGSDAAARSQTTDHIGDQARRFIVVGLVATGMHFLVMTLAIFGLGVSYMTVATIMGTCVGILVAYIGHYRFTFGSEGHHGARFGMFVLVYGVVMALHAGLMFILGDTFGLPYAVPFVIATALAATVTFFLNRQIVFRQAF